jgi:hypothetical protein
VERTTALFFDGKRSSSGPGGAFFEAWMRHAGDGHRLAVVMDTTPEYLAARGVTEVLTV